MVRKEFRNSATVDPPRLLRHLYSEPYAIQIKPAEIGWKRVNAVLSKLRTKALASAFPVIFKLDDPNRALRRLGTSYGGWWVPCDLLGPNSICYCAGAGTDISFDLALIETFGSSVYSFDPTPKSIDWVASRIDLDERFTFLPVGLGGHAGVERFYAPTNPNHVSHSMKNIQGTKSFFEARVQTVTGLMNELGHSRLDLVKFDIEGAEHETIAQMIKDGLRPSIVCVEYDQPEPVNWAIGTTRLLHKSDYELVKVDGFNLTFVYRLALDRSQK